MQRLYDFLRRHPTGVDSFWAVLLLGMSALQVVAESTHPYRMRLAMAGISGLLCLVWALRRRYPEKMLLLAIAAGVAQLALDTQVVVADFAMLMIVYTVASCGARWASRVALVGALSAATLADWRWPSGVDSSGNRIVSVVFLTVPFALAWVIGDSVRTRRAYYAQLEERAERLHREREAQAKAAVAAERARIARELHDVVAHNVSVMVVQADGAAYVLDSSPDQAKQALGTISQTGRLALAEMRRLLGLLRASDDSGGEYVPQPGVDQLGDLIEQVRGAGLPVDFAVAGRPRPLSSGVELTAYRIVQEALTNTRKHGGPDVSATVQLTYGDAELRMLIEDDGRGAQREHYEDGAGGADGLGQGLIGMRERIAMVGGTIDTGPRPGGGFRIAAALPLKPAR
ncbi:sensor histidine kinase [Streptomyces sp. PTM05]|uniref:histidine kinase n=1 Tax=Streptantibioticus parmotrematis TaxID=2873249 RepID=A0ABS7QZU0_9ACTN|nr:histidine kinase [Streptantibioticus parmotrematis]MBY8888733.1 sensor histidine kinase [Streptantibioticus parmotrematis]